MYNRETRSYALSKGHKLKMLLNKIIRKISEM
jgi:hypothetical protein